MALPTVTTGGVFNSATLSNATDVAGTVTATVSAAFLTGTITVTFGYPYSVAPIVVITYADSNGATYAGFAVVTSTTTSFTYTNNSAVALTFNYHIFETQ